MAPSVRRPRHKYAAASLSPSCLRKLRVPGEFAARLDAGSGAAGEEEEELEQREVLVVSPLGKVWRVELCRQEDGGGAWWLGSGWAELVAAHGVGEGWSVVLRCERRGVATVSAFRPDYCLTRFCTPHAGVRCKNRPRFIKLLQPEDLEKMKIPDKFVQQHLTETESCPSSQNAMIFSPLGKFCRVELDRGQSGAQFGDGWARFLTAHDLSEGNILLFRYEGNIVFSVEVFMENGCLKEHNRADALNLTDHAKGPGTAHQQTPPISKKRKKRKASGKCVEGSGKEQNVSPVSAKKVGSQSQRKLAGIVPRHSFTKKITGYCIRSLFAVKGTFCSSVGLVGACTIKLQTSMDSKRSWPVAFSTANTYGYITGPGWRRFCRDNKVEEGDQCTFNILETTVWHVLIN